MSADNIWVFTPGLKGKIYVFDLNFSDVSSVEGWCEDDLESRRKVLAYVFNRQLNQKVGEYNTAPQAYRAYKKALHKGAIIEYGVSGYLVDYIPPGEFN